MAQWHPDLRFRGSPVLRNAEIPERNLQDARIAYPLGGELDASPELEAAANAETAFEISFKISSRADRDPLVGELETFIKFDAAANARSTYNMPSIMPPTMPSGASPHPFNWRFERAGRRLLPVYYNYIVPILRFRGPYFNYETMISLGITLVPMDFITGDLFPGHVKYFQPMRNEHLNDQILKTKTHTHVREYKSRVGIDSNSNHENDYAKAISIWERGVAFFLSASDLSAGENDDHLPQLRRDFTRWRVAINGYRQIHHRDGNGTNWSAEGIFHYYTQDGSQPDVSKPHVVAFVADEAPVLAGLPSTSAVKTAFWLAGAAALQDFACNQSIFPVTVVCCSGHKVRVVQVVIDLPRHAVEIRLSQVIDLRDAPFGDWTSFLHFLGWFLPDPIGDTATL